MKPKPTEPDAVIGPNGTLPAKARIDTGQMLNVIWRRGSDGVGILGRLPRPDDPPDVNGNPRKWVELAGIRLRDPAHRQALLDLVAQGELDTDAYISLNAFRDEDWYLSPVTGKPTVARKETNCRWLNWLYADIDCGRPESDCVRQRMDAIDAQAIVERAAQNGLIPPVSVLAFTGRGLLVLWNIHDEREPYHGAYASGVNVAIYRKLNQYLQDVLRAAGLYVDEIYDAARVARVSQSINSKTQKLVNYRVWVHNNEWPTYTLPGIAKQIGYSDYARLSDDSLAEYRKRLKQARRPGTAPNRANSPRQQGQNAKSDMEIISIEMGGFRKRGSAFRWHGRDLRGYGRRRTLTMYAQFCHKAGYSQDDTLAEANKLAQSMVPPYPSDPRPEDIDTDSIVADVYRNRTPNIWQADKVCQCLGVTEELAEQLDLKWIAPKSLKKRRMTERTTRDDMRKARLSFLESIIDESRRVPSTGELAETYYLNGYCKTANRQTANRDINQICKKRGIRRPMAAVRNLAIIANQPHLDF